MASFNIFGKWVEKIPYLIVNILFHRNKDSYRKPIVLHIKTLLFFTLSEFIVEIRKRYCPLHNASCRRPPIFGDVYIIIMLSTDNNKHKRFVLFL